MSTQTNREKNVAHDNKEVLRPKSVHYDFTALEQAVQAWHTKALA